MSSNAESKAIVARTRERCSFALRGSADGAESSPSRPRRNKRRFRPRAAGGLSHTVPALDGPIGAPELTVLTTKDSCIIERWLKEYVPSYNEANIQNSNSYSILGFDIESIAKAPWMPNRASLPDGPATIQLSTPDSCLIVQLARLGDGSAANAPAILRDSIINNPNVILVGVGIDDDALEMYRWSKESSTVNNGSKLWEMTSRFDIGCILPSHNPGRRIGLKEVASTILGVEIKKNKNLQMSNWGRMHLAPEQISYAARDAWVSAAVVEKLKRDNSNVFSAKALLEHEFMKSQRSLKEIHERAITRKNAKLEYKSLLEQEKETGMSVGAERINELKEVMDLNRPDYPPSFPEEDFLLPFH